MDTRFTARLPDGSRTRGAWWLWMAGGVLLGWTALSASGFVRILAVALSELTTGSSTIYWVLNVLGLCALEVAIARGGLFARSRLLMPPEVWLAALLPPVGFALLTAFVLPEAYGTGESAVVAIMIVLAGLWVRSRSAERTDGGTGERATSV